MKLSEQGTSWRGSGPEHGGCFLSKRPESLRRGAMWGEDVI